MGVKQISNLCCTKMGEIEQIEIIVMAEVVQMHR